LFRFITALAHSPVPTGSGPRGNAFGSTVDGESAARSHRRVAAALPIVYNAARAWLAVFRAPAAVVDRLVPPGLVAARFIPRVVPMVVAVFDYANTSIGPYREAGISFLARRSSLTARVPFVPIVAERWMKDLGAWVHLLPVDTEVACDAGRAHWGFPKFVAKIDIEVRGDTMHCDVFEDDAPVFGMTLTRPAGAREPARFPMRLWSKLGRELLFTQVPIDARGVTRRGGHAELRFANHARVDRLRGLGLERARPLEVRWFDEWRTTLDRADRRFPMAEVDSRASV
jgi:hypothetical protein